MAKGFDARVIPIQDSVRHSHRPVAVIGLIVLNAVPFLVQLSLTHGQTITFLQEWALVPRRYFDWDWAAANGLDPLVLWPFVTNTFLHGGFLHILLNMWMLWIFGRALEDRLGSVPFMMLYLVSGIAASFVHCVFNAGSTLPVLGASGAVAGLISAYALRFPYAWLTIVVPVFFIPLIFSVPVLAFAVVWFSMQILEGFTSAMQPSVGGGIAWWAHIGGFVTGWLLIGPLDRRVGRTHGSLPWQG